MEDFSDVKKVLWRALEPFRSGLFPNLKLVERYTPGCMLSGEEVLPLSLIIVEAVTNAVKHAGAKGMVTVCVNCYKDPQSCVIVEVMDDGPGMGMATVKRRFGLRLIYALSAQMGATVNFISAAKGLTFQLQFCPRGPE